MEKHGKVLPDRLEAGRDHLFGRRADDDVIPVLHRQAQQLVANRSAYDVGLHLLAYGSSAATNSVSRRAASQYSRIAGSALTASQ